MADAESQASAKRARTNCGEKIEALVQWFLAGGGELNGIEISGGFWQTKGDSEQAREFVAVRDVSAKECVLKLPHSLVLSTRVALESAVGKCIVRQPGLRVLTESSVEEERVKWEQGAGSEEGFADDGSQVVTARSILYAYLIHQRWVDTSDGAFAAYAAALPDAYSTPFSWPRAELQRHSDMASEVCLLEAHLHAQYDILFPRLSQGDTAAMFPAAVFTKEAWMWAHGSYQTRCFPRYREGAASKLEKEEDGMLLPLIDMLNHDHSGCNATLTTGEEHHDLNGRDGRAVHTHVALKMREPLLYSCESIDYESD